VKLSKTVDFGEDEISKTRAAKSASLTLSATFERDGNRYCLVAKAQAKLNGTSKDFELGRFCIDVSGNCIEGSQDLGGGFEFKWKLCIEDGGHKLCLYGTICKDFGFPVGELCTPNAKVCVDIVAK
jgi:hypothetical protein